MPIKRCTKQSGKTLEEFYNFLSNQNAYFIDVAKQMFAFIDLIDTVFKDTLIWGVTSHERLVLVTENNTSAKWYVIVTSVGTSVYYFEYLIPVDKQPWDNAYVRGEASSIEEAKKYLLVAMNESGGWKDSIELNCLLDSNNIKTKD